MDKKQGKPNIEKDMSFINETGKRLYELRNKHEYTQKQVAQIAGVNYSSYSAWEIGEYKAGRLDRQPVDMKGKHAVTLAKLYGVSTDYILDHSKFESVDGKAIIESTGLSDKAVQILQKNKGVEYCPAARVVSDLLVDYDKNGENSLLYALDQYTRVLPDTNISVSLNTGRPAPGPFGTDIPLSGALLYQIVAAADRFKTALLKRKRIPNQR